MGSTRDEHDQIKSTLAAALLGNKVIHISSDIARLAMCVM